MMTGWTMTPDAWAWMGAWALVLILVVWLLVREPRRETPDPGAIVRARFARGEIGEEELRRALEALGDDRASPPRAASAQPGDAAREPGVRHD